jgi:hypothetical protein
MMLHLNPMYYGPVKCTSGYLQNNALLGGFLVSLCAYYCGLVDASVLLGWPMIRPLQVFF